MGACIAVIVAGMPAMLALMKIKELHVAVNSRMDKFIAATLEQSTDREAATVKESESRVVGLTHSRDLLIVQNTQLIEHLAELAKRIDSLPCSALTVGIPDQKNPPCEV
jgi:UDP-N-acetyl-D-mannosaminuronate dehydrogenase